MRDIPYSYDERCRLEFQALISRVDHLFVDIDIDCPYGLPYVSTFHQATFAPLSDRAMELFLGAGYRRNGNCLYNMRCKNCIACTPIRLSPSAFKPNRNQKRTVKKNGDVKNDLLPLKPDIENLELCEKFLSSRYPKENNCSHGYFRDFFLNNIVSSAQIQYRVEETLVGTSVIDIGYNWLNAVYFYFDPVESKRSLGTYNIMHLVDICLEWELDYLYLGYLIDTVPAMSYKRNFKPHFVLRDQKWQCYA